MMNKIKAFIAFGIIGFGVFSLCMPAFARLLISPLYIVMEGRDRKSEVVVVNSGNQEVIYQLKWQLSEQVEGLGGFVDVEEQEGRIYLHDFAVFSPRQFTLQPGKKQTIRMAVRRPADLPEGEYKTHLQFASQAINREQEVVRDGKARFRAKLNYSYSIPVIYRVGDYDLQVELGNPTMNVSQSNQNLVLNLPIRRSGKHGTLAHIQVYHQPLGGKEILLSEIAGGSVYPEITSRNVEIPLPVRTLQNGNLRIVYMKGEGKKQNYTVLAEKIVPIQN